MTKSRSNAVANAAKGDLTVGSGTNLSGVLGVGSNGDTIVADSSTATGLRYQAPVNANPVLNSAFQIWQRGTLFSASNATADRWFINPSGATATLTRQITNDTTNLPSIQYCARYQRTAGNTVTSTQYLNTSFETINSIPYAGKTVTFSFYARAGANFSATSNVLSSRLLSGTGTDQNFNNVAYTGQTTVAGTSSILTTTWQRFQYTGTIAANATELAVVFDYVPTGTAGAADYFEVTGVMIEVGSVAGPFKTYGATIQGELAACQRYYYRNQVDASLRMFGTGWNGSTTVHYSLVNFPVTMRIRPTALEQSGTATHYQVAHGNTVTVCSVVPNYGSDTTEKSAAVQLGVASGLTAGQGAAAYSANAAAYLGWSAEL